VVINNVLDQHRLFNSWSSHHFEYGVMLAHPITFIDSGIQDVIKRLRYSERFPGVPPFPGDYSQQPDWWKKALIIMDKSFIDAAKYKAERQKD
jgi:hypothetical protein